MRTEPAAPAKAKRTPITPEIELNLTRRIRLAVITDKGIMVYPSGRIGILTAVGQLVGTRTELKGTIEDIIPARTDPQSALVTEASAAPESCHSRQPPVRPSSRRCSS